MKVSLLVLLAVAQALLAGIQVSENTTSRLSFIWEMENVGVADSSGNGASVWFKNQNVDLGDSGEAAMPGFSFYVGIPPQGAITIQWTPLQTRTIALRHAMRKRLGPKGIKRLPDLHFADQWLSTPRAAVFGKLRANQFIVKPFLYDEKTNSLTVLEKASCVVTFPASPRQSGGGVSRPSDYQRMLSKLLINYDIASSWSIAPAGGSLGKRAMAPQFPLSPGGQSLGAFSIGDGHDSINEATINENGMIKLSGSSLIGLFGTGVSWNRLACYASYKGELPATAPDILTLPDGITEVPLLRCDLNNNGVVDSGDYAFFYGTGSSDWAFDTATHQFQFKLDRYEDSRHYWLSLKPTGNALTLQSMAPLSAPASSVRTSFLNRIRFKNPQEISLAGGDPAHGQEGGLDWIWARLLSSAPPFQYQVNLPQVDTASPVSMNFYLTDLIGSLVVHAAFGGIPVCDTCSSSGWHTFVYGGDHTARISGSKFYDDPTTHSSIAIEAIDFKYSSKLDMAGALAMTVFSPETSAIVQYRLSNLPREPVYIFRINSKEEALLVDTPNGLNGSTYSWTDTAGIGIKYYTAAKSASKPAPQLQQVSLSSASHILHDLRSGADRADFLVIAHPDFLAQADTLAGHKKSCGRFSDPKVVDVNDIYRQFSGGNIDPAAIRNFLIYAKAQWDTSEHLDYVVLMGKGNYNFKHIKTNSNIYIPVAEFGSMCYDDFFSYLNAGDNADNNSAIPAPAIFIGRLSCQSPGEAKQMVDKIIDMENPALADFGAWRNRALLVSDDDMQGDRVDALGSQHFQSSERMGSLLLSERPSVELQKVNLFEYPWTATWEKPEARDALLNGINNGVSIVNWFGHGSSTQWADEMILTKDLVGNLHNSKRYPLIASFSCDVGRIDRPDLSLSEVLTNAPQSGAIAAFSSTREAYASENEALGLAFFGALFDSASVGTTYGAAYAASKAQVRDVNQKTYCLLGDPSVRPVNPLRRLKIDITNSAGAPIDTLKAMQSITVHGTILGRDAAAIDAQYGSASQPASVQIGIFNPPSIAKRKDGGSPAKLDPVYSLPGTPVFSGLAEVKNGTFEISVHLPRKVTFKTPGAEVIAFGWQGFNNALGWKAITFNGMDTSAALDTSGPSISIRPLYDGASTSSGGANTFAARTDGIHTALPFKCEIDVSDSSGVAVAGTGPDEGLGFEVPGVLSKQNINNKFQFSGGDYRKGSAVLDFSAGQIPSGSYTLSITAQDLSGNVTKKNFTLEIAGDQDLTISRVFNFPNPVKMGQTTAFYFDLSRTSGVTATIKVYTLSGKLVRVFYNAYSGEIFDGKDQMGNLLGPKVYLYQVVAQDNGGQSGQSRSAKSSICKLVMHPPR